MGRNAGGGGRRIAGPSGARMSGGLTEIANEARSFPSVDEAYEYFLGREGVPAAVAQEFFDTFGGSGDLTPRRAFERFYDFITQ